jgi:hypothetical protein
MLTEKGIDIQGRYMATEWTHFFTGTLAGMDTTRGGIFLALKDFTARLDPEGRGDHLLWICERGDKGVPHAHGVLVAPQSCRRISAAWRGGFATTRPFLPQLRENLLDYIQGHDFNFPVNFTVIKE